MNENEKNWLIRTKNKKIFGPVSKNKIEEFIKKGSLTDEDELSSGNGYWFWIKEKDYLNKFLYQGQPQGFNPIAEAESVISPPVVALKNEPVIEKEEEIEYPEMDDLEYPDIDQDITQPRLPLPTQATQATQTTQGNQANQDNVVSLKPRTKPSAAKAQNLVQAAKVEKKDLLDTPTRKSLKSKKPKKQRDDRFLIYALVLLSLLVGWLTYFYYVKVLNEPLPFLNFNQIIKPAYAQTYSPSKKKTFLLKANQEEILIEHNRSGLGNSLDLERSPKVNCSELASNAELFAYSFKKKEMVLNLSQCQLLTKSLKSIQLLDSKDLFDEVYFSNFLKNLKWSSKAQKEILEIFRIKFENRKKTKQVFDLFLKSRDALPVDSIAEIIYYEKRSEEIEKSSSLTWKLIFQIDMALDRKNLGLAKTQISRLISYRSELGDFDFDHLVKADESEKAIKYLKYNFGKVKKSFGNGIMVKMYIRKILDLMKGKIRTSLIDSYKVDWSLSEIRSFIQTDGVGRESFPFWLELLEMRGKDNEIKQLVQEFSSKSSLENLKSEYLWIFRYVLPDNIKQRKLIVKKIDSLIESKETYQKHLGLQILENDILKKEMEKFNKKYAKPLFQMKRSFYRDELKKGQSWKYSLFNLAKIGNIESTFFWWNIL